MWAPNPLSLPGRLISCCCFCRFDEQPQAKAKHLMPTFPIKSTTGQGSHHHRQH